MDDAKQIVSEIRAKLAELERALGVVPTPPSAEPDFAPEDEIPAPVSESASEQTVYDMFGAKPEAGNDSVEEEEETDSEDEGTDQEDDDSFEDVDAADAANLIDEEDFDEDEERVYEAVSKADKQVGFALERITVLTGIKPTKLKRILAKLFLENRITRVRLRPAMYRVK